MHVRNRLITVFKSKFLHGMLTGLLPSMFAIIAVCQTNEQLDYLREQISYTRKPAILFHLQPNPTSTFKTVLLIGNIGNEAAETVHVKGRMFLVTHETVYSYGQSGFGKSCFVDTSRTPRGIIWPRLSLGPNEKIDFTRRLSDLLLSPFHCCFDDSNWSEQVLYAPIEITNQLDGLLVTFLECSYRRKSDYSLFADSIFLVYHARESYTDVREEIGGVNIANRIVNYIMNGPELSINIERDHFVVYEHVFGDIVRHSPHSIYPRIGRPDN